MEELEHEIEAATAPQEPEQAEDELAGEPEEENTGTCPRAACWPFLRTHTHFLVRYAGGARQQYPQLCMRAARGNNCCKGNSWLYTGCSQISCMPMVQGNGLPGPWMQSMWPARRSSLRKRTGACWSCSGRRSSTGPPGNMPMRPGRRLATPTVLHSRTGPTR